MIGLLSHFAFLLLKLAGTPSFPPPLAKDEEKRLFERAAKGDRAARKTLIEHNLRLVAHIVKKYYAPGGENDDLLSIGTVGLIKAIDTYKPDSGTRFATYAGKCMQNEILMYFRSQKKQAQETSLNEPVETDKDGNPLTYLDIVCSDEDIAETTFRRLQVQKLHACVEKALDPVEKRIIVMRYGLDGREPATQREVAEKLGISRSYVSRLESGAVQKLREAMEKP